MLVDEEDDPAGAISSSLVLHTNRHQVTWCCIHRLCTDSGGRSYLLLAVAQGPPPLPDLRRGKTSTFSRLRSSIHCFNQFGMADRPLTEADTVDSR
jgi:hypothetical protein